MAKAIHSLLVGDDGEIHVEHVFYGHTEEEAQIHRSQHLAGCPALSAAETHDLGHPEDEEHLLEWTEDLPDHELPTPEDFEEEDDDEDDEGGTACVPHEHEHER